MQVYTMCTAAILIAAFGSARAAASCSSPDSTGTSICAVDPAIDPLAVCNDGTVPVFTFRPGRGDGAARWLIWLEGGGQCADTTSCVERGKAAKGLLTSNDFSISPQGGILSPDAMINPRLHDANVVVVHYCSSDDWAGEHQSKAMFDVGNPATWHFQGRRVALAAIASVAEVAPSFASARRIVIGGSSAGGVGITVTANDILPRLPPASDIRVVNDGGFAVNLGQYDTDVGAPFVFPGQHNAFFALFKSGITLWHGRGDATCDAMATSMEDRVDCFSAKVFQAGYVHVPSFVAESQLDTAQLSDEICPSDYGKCPISHSATSDEGIYAAAFSRNMAQSLLATDTLAAYAVFSPNAYMHTILNNASQFGVRHAFPGAMLSAQKVFNRWLATSGKARIVEIGN